jgi:single-strand DNA-binding protein
MANFNKVILIGNLTRDPELRYTPKGTAIARITVAVNRTWRSDSGEQREETSFVDVDAFGRQAETIGQYLKRGRPILVEGRLRQDSWEDKQTGQKRSKLMVHLENFQFMDAGKGREGGSAEGGDSISQAGPSAAPAQRPSRPPTSRPPAEDGMGDDDDVPF